MGRYPDQKLPREKSYRIRTPVRGRRARRTELPLEESDWERILPLLKGELKDRTRDWMIVRMLHLNGNQSLSEEAICELTKVKLFGLGQCQVLNSVFSWHDLPYRLNVDQNKPEKPHYKIFVVR